MTDQPPTAPEPAPEQDGDLPLTGGETMDPIDWEELVSQAHPDQLYELIEGMPDMEAEALLRALGARDSGVPMPTEPLGLAQMIVQDFQPRPHLRYLSQRIAQAMRDVEEGKSRRLIVAMPPRSGKTLLATQVTAAWALGTHPSWPVVLASYSGTLATAWGREVRRWAADGQVGNLAVAHDAGAASQWQTTAGGWLYSRSVREQLTGSGAKVMVIDDPHKDFVDAHSAVERDRVWNWWLTVAQTRLHPPSLVIAIMTRWHEDDLVGRLLSPEYPGRPEDWEVINFPAIAEEGDALGREPGQPLYSPLIDETEEEALARWEDTRESVGSYAWSALYQQRPAPEQGAIFENSWWRYWTTDPALADGERVVLLPTGTPETSVAATEGDAGPGPDVANGQWVDSWDCTFKAGEASDFVVGQRWVRLGANRYLIAQQRGRLSFTQTLDRMRAWARPSDPLDPTLSPYGERVHQRLIEDAANGPAVIDTMRKEIAGVKPIRAKNSKEARARAVTPEIESGNVFLPHPSEPGYGWVTELIGEFREFPHGAHDDQVDALTQALLHLRGDEGAGAISVPTGARPDGAARAAGMLQARSARGGGGASGMAGVRIPGRSSR